MVAPPPPEGVNVMMSPSTTSPGVEVPSTGNSPDQGITAAGEREGADSRAIDRHGDGDGAGRGAFGESERALDAAALGRHGCAGSRGSADRGRARIDGLFVDRPVDGESHFSSLQKQGAAVVAALVRVQNRIGRSRGARLTLRAIGTSKFVISTACELEDVLVELFYERRLRYKPRSGVGYLPV
jgi:hypothetical protein